MNRTVAHLATVTGIAAAALTFSVSAAHAETPPAPKPGFDIGLGPVEPGHPQGPGDLKTPDPEPQPPKGPKDLGTPKKDPEPQPDGPKDLAVPAPDPVVDPKPADPAPTVAPKTSTPNADAPDATVAPDVAAPDVAVAPEVEPVESASDAAATSSTVSAGSHGHDLAWALAGTGLGLCGLVLVAARRRRQADEA